MNRKLNLITSSLLTAVVILGISSCSHDKDNDSTTQPMPLLENYSLKSAGIYPEGIDFDSKNNRFVMSSFNKGMVYTLSADGKTFSPLVNDASLTAALGVYTDEANNRIIIASGDAGASEKSGTNGSTAGKIAYAGIYNAQTGALIKGINLKPLTAAGAFPNDIALDANGNIYITDSFSPVIYKIDKDYNASIFVNNPAFAVPAGTFGLNGIVYHKDGYLIAAHTQANKLFKINISNGSVTEITGLDNAFKAPDGLEWHGNNLIVVENGLAEGKVHLLSGTNNWATASKTKEIAIGQTEFPTTAYVADNGITYVLTTYLGKLLSGDKTQTDYQLKGIKF
ncbi:hypothetical protein [Chryseobacterium sp. OSA05B]|uniref:hypothetical protein n=1 Tax=Chryseobacterium sp. OSA05B TaxID=2862650 RepID=UPI001CBE165B|nr:hypothetical protein [Chryseobacterium sp. OSA05B]